MEIFIVKGYFDDEDRVDEVVKAIKRVLKKMGWEVDERMTIRREGLLEEIALECLPRNLICPECGQFRPDDERVKAGMKCSYCAYGT